MRRYTGVNGMALSGKARLTYIDYMRGLACLFMFQYHSYDSWLNEASRKTTFWMWVQLIGGFAAPLFLFLAGVSFAIVTDKLRQRGVVADDIARKTIRRGAEIFGLGLLFRLQQWAFNWRWAPWSDLLRVDVLNTIGLSMMLMGAACWVFAGSRPSRLRTATVGIAGALFFALLTPPLYTSWRPSFLPWPLESYLNGVHTFKEPPGWLFPIFPWAGFAFAGLAVGFVLMSDWARKHEAGAVTAIAASGTGIIVLARWLDAQPRQLYAVYNFWLTSPNYFLIRVGVMLMIMLAAYAWCRWGAGQWGFSPVIQLGQTSLLVYWVHIEFVYGRFMILRSHANPIREASLGLLTIVVAMVLLSVVKTRLTGRGADFFGWLRRWRAAQA
jgi:uncharacterized membrane protein